MEHRQSMRVPASVNLDLYKRGAPVGTGQMRDLSRDGLFLKTTFNGARVNDVLEIELPGSTGLELSHNRAHAVVVYKDSDGLGMMLMDERQLRALPQLYAWLRRRARNEQAGEPGKMSGLRGKISKTGQH
ncbi:MAG: PilZ domain-containing protein [Oleiphilaceae bacterium]|nr:PilZ domain-containing protein [Oleiphilaceae bacterium]